MDQGSGNEEEWEPVLYAKKTLQGQPPHCRPTMTPGKSPTRRMLVGLPSCSVGTRGTG